MTSLYAVNSEGVSQEVIDAEEAHNNATRPRCFLSLARHTALSQRDAEYVVQCLRMHLQEVEDERILLSLALADWNGISDEAIDI
jgi:hypothetical protein